MAPRLTLMHACIGLIKEVRDCYDTHNLDPISEAHQQYLPKLAWIIILAIISGWLRIVKCIIIF